MKSLVSATTVHCYRFTFSTFKKNYHLEIKKSLKARPLSMHSSDVEGMVLPPKPPKRKQDKHKDKDKSPTVSENSDPKSNVTKTKKEKKEKTGLVGFKNTLKKEKKVDKRKDEDMRASNDSLLSASSSSSSFPPSQPTSLPPLPPVPPPTTMLSNSAIAGSKISLNELQGGLKSLAKRRPEVATINDSLFKAQEDNSRRNSTSVNKPPPPPKPSDITGGSQSLTLPRPRKPPLPPNRPLTSTKSTTGTPGKPVERSHSISSTGNSSSADVQRCQQKPMPATRPSMKPRPNKPRPDIPPKATEVCDLTIDQANLKPELIPISESLQLVHKVVMNLISLARSRQSENIGEKAENGTSCSEELVDKLSSYRDSIGPVARMKVNKHFTAIKNNVDDFSAFSRDLPRIPTATDLEKMSKTLNILCNALEDLAKSLPEF